MWNLFPRGAHRIAPPHVRPGPQPTWWHRRHIVGADDDVHGQEEPWRRRWCAGRDGSLTLLVPLTRLARTMSGLIQDLARAGRLDSPSRAQRVAYFAGALLVLSGLFHVAVYLVDGGPWEGP